MKATGTAHRRVQLPVRFPAMLCSQEKPGLKPKVASGAVVGGAFVASLVALWLWWRRIGPCKRRGGHKHEIDADLPPAHFTDRGPRYDEEEHTDAFTGAQPPSYTMATPQDQLPIIEVPSSSSGDSAARPLAMSGPSTSDAISQEHDRAEAHRRQLLQTGMNPEADGSKGAFPEPHASSTSFRSGQTAASKEGSIKGSFSGGHE